MANHDLMYFNETNQHSLSNEVEWLFALLENQGHMMSASQRAKLKTLLQSQSRRLTNKNLLVHQDEEDDNKGGAQIEAEIAAIQAELVDYKAAGLSLNTKKQLCLNLSGTLIPLPRAQYLSSRNALLKIPAIKQASLTKPVKAPPNTLIHKIADIIRKFCNIAKKFVDLIDDVWTPIGNTLVPKAIVDLVSPLLVGITSGIVHFAEASVGLYNLIKAIFKTNTSIRQTKIVTNGLITALAGAGLGMSAAYLASSAAVAIAGSAFMPALIPGLLVCVFVTSLWKNAYKLHDVKAQISQLERNNIKLLANIEQLKNQTSRLVNAREKLMTPNPTATPIQLKQNAEALMASYSQETVNNMKIATANANIKKNITKLAILADKRKKAEREVAFKTLETIAATIVFVGVVLGTVAIVGAASAASFGMVPLAICIVGVAIGLTLKIFEWFDAKKNHRLSNGIIEKLKNGWNSIFSNEKQKEPIKENTIEKSSTAITYGKLDAKPESGTTPEKAVTPLVAPAAELNLPQQQTTKESDHPRRRFAY